jgi:ATP-binding cassette, subfamily C (CFTR/MRP), member 1
VDTLLPRTVKMYMGTMGKVISTLLYISIVTPFFFLFLFPILFYYYRAQQYFIKTSRELTRLDSLSRSPIYALFAETLDGLSTIRAFGDEARLTSKSNKLLDSNQQAYFLNFSANCWLAVRLELAGACIVTFTALSAVFSRQFYTDASEESRHQFAGMAGLGISLALGVTQSLNWSVRMASDLESHMVAVERLENFAEMEQELAHETSGEMQSQLQRQGQGQGQGQGEWPREGDVLLKDVSFRYRPNLPLVLNKLNVHILPREKVGIVVSTVT